jgi:hypothetical protein
MVGFHYKKYLKICFNIFLSIKSDSSNPLIPLGLLTKCYKKYSSFSTVQRYMLIGSFSAQ